MRQYAGFADAEESNKRFKYLLEQGQSGLSVAFDLPTQMGFDSQSHGQSRSGTRGCCPGYPADMEILFEIPLDKIPNSHDQFNGGHHPGDVPGRG
jgi:methylmalonyl-CoA mutase N-terminal domain/subunit